MSALGQKQTCAVYKPMSAKCHKRNDAVQQKAPYLITASTRASTDVEIARPSAFAVLRLITSSYCRRLDRQVGRLFALEDAIDVAAARRNWSMMSGHRRSNHQR